MPMNIENIRQKVMAYLNDPANEDEIAEAVALEVSRAMAPLVVDEMAGTMQPQELRDDKPERNADTQPPDDGEPAGEPASEPASELGTPSPDFDHRPPRG